MEQSTVAKGKPRIYCIIADHTGSISATIYQGDDDSKFKKGSSLLLVNALVKDTFLAITSQTDVGICGSIEVPPHIVETAPKLFQPNKLQEMTIKDALDSPDKTMVAVKGKILNVSPADTRRNAGGNVPYQELTLKNGTGASTVAVWNDLVEKLTIYASKSLNSFPILAMVHLASVRGIVKCFTSRFSSAVAYVAISSMFLGYYMAYKAYIQTLLKYGKYTKTSQLTTQLWNKDTDGEMDDVDECGARYAQHGN
ncbi:uncharacterized protein LOC117321478 [Pecten maximus]|uniref:uncharacterized protein LOC117321478 n=1 Tax=Pecten maximus TaxID=6579 RepID=UPI001458AF7C|nr:uncharacterized protein LOC117321478 [Pecten maximus]